MTPRGFVAPPAWVSGTIGWACKYVGRLSSWLPGFEVCHRRVSIVLLGLDGDGPHDSGRQSLTPVSPRSMYDILLCSAAAAAYSRWSWSSGDNAKFIMSAESSLLGGSSALSGASSVLSKGRSGDTERGGLGRAGTSEKSSSWVVLSMMTVLIFLIGVRNLLDGCVCWPKCSNSVLECRVVFEFARLLVVQVLHMPRS